MKLSEKTSRRLGRALLVGVPLLLIVPNILLGVMGNMSAAAILANILLPLGVAILLVCYGGRVGFNTLLMFPLMFLAAFQIVLLFLYADGSIIGVDMFLNVATTNASEALELLENLRPAIITVLILYLPPLVVAAIALRHGIRPSTRSRKRARTCGLVCAGAGAVALTACAVAEPAYKVDEDFYPLNVFCNLGAAVNRSYSSARYPQTSGDFRFGATSIHPAQEREIYVAVIGETSRAADWQLFGYHRFTTPRLCSLPAGTVAAFGSAISESNTTHKSVPLMLSTMSAQTFADSVNTTKSVITAFKEAGFATTAVSMQCRNGSYIDYFLDEADTTIFLREPEPGKVRPGIYDVDMLGVVDSIIGCGARKQLIVLHQYGSHFNYADRYPRQEAFFIPDKTAEAEAVNRGQLVNAYDNAIRQTDRLLAGLIERLDSVGCMGGMIYTSDHGEDIYDDARQRFLHASPTPTYYQLHVPMLLYMTPRLHTMRPRLMANALSHQRALVSSSATYTPTLLHMAGLRTPRLERDKALTSGKFRAADELYFLSDRNRAESLHEAGFCALDFAKLQKVRSTTAQAIPFRQRRAAP